MKTAMCVALAFAGIAPGQTKPKDVDGWGKIKWGMTVAQAQAAYGPAAKLPSSLRPMTFVHAVNFPVPDSFQASDQIVGTGGDK